MKALIVIGVIVLVLFLFGLIRVGAEAIYDDRGFRLALRIWFLRIILGGRDKPKKEKKKKGKNEPDEASGEEKPKKKRLSMPLLHCLARRAYEFLCRSIRDRQIDVLKLHFTSAYDDPAVTALAYGVAGTAMDALQRIGRGHIACSDLRADVDFGRSEPQYDFHIGVRFRFGRLLGSAFRFGFGVLFDFLRDKRKEHSHG